MPQPNKELKNLPEAGHLLLGPGTVFSAAEVQDMLAEARGDGPKWGAVFNDRAPTIP